MKRYDLSDLRRRIEKLEARLAELEKSKAGPESRLCNTCNEKNECYMRTCVFYINTRACYVPEPEPEPKPEPKPEQWKPYPIYFNFESIVQHPQAQWMEEKVTRYTKQLQWLFEHYPEQNGEWSEDTEYSVRYDVDNKKYVSSSFRYLLPVNLIFMSRKATKHLAADMNSGKVRF